MRSKVTLPWNAAAWRQSTYEPRVRKVHGPVGEQHEPWPTSVRDRTCRGCGHHVCSCREWCNHGCGLDVCSCERQPCYTLFNVSYTKPKPEPREYNFGACDIPIVVDPRLRPGEAWLLQPPNPGPAGPVATVCHCQRCNGRRLHPAS